MSDERLRDAERRWKTSGLAADADAYLLELERAGAPEEERLRVRGRWGQVSEGYTVADVLAQLDTSAAGFTFPMLDNGYVYPGGVRLTTWRDLTRWALIIEVIGYSPRGDSIDDCLHVFGNVLGDRAPGTSNTDFLYFVHDGPSGSLLGDEEDLNPEAQDVRIRDQVIEVRRDPAYFAERGVALAEPPRIGLEEFMRALVVDHRPALLATEAELQERLPADLPRFLRLDEWAHPDVVTGALPSQSEAFQQLAEALVGGNPEAYAPTEPPNTHWSNWPDGGSL